MEKFKEIKDIFDILIITEQGETVLTLEAIEALLKGLLENRNQLLNESAVIVSQLDIRLAEKLKETLTDCFSVNKSTAEVVTIVRNSIYYYCKNLYTESGIDYKDLNVEKRDRISSIALETIKGQNLLLFMTKDYLIIPFEL